jgi:hypothetical protein
MDTNEDILFRIPRSVGSSRWLRNTRLYSSVNPSARTGMDEKDWPDPAAYFA